MHHRKHIVRIEHICMMDITVAERTSASAHGGSRNGSTFLQLYQISWIAWSTGLQVICSQGSLRRGTMWFKLHVYRIVERVETDSIIIIVSLPILFLLFSFSLLILLFVLVFFMITITIILITYIASIVIIVTATIIILFAITVIFAILLCSFLCLCVFRVLSVLLPNPRTRLIPWHVLIACTAWLLFCLFGALSELYIYMHEPANPSPNLCNRVQSLHFCPRALDPET